MTMITPDFTSRPETLASSEVSVNRSFGTVPAGLESVALRVESTTAVAVGEVLGVVILDGRFACHVANGSGGQIARPTHLTWNTA